MKKVIAGAVLTAGLLVGCSNDRDAELTEEITALKQQVEQVTLENEDLLSALKEEREAFKEALEGKKDIGEDGTSEESVEETVLVKAEEIEEYPMTLYKEDVLGSDENETVELYVNAEVYEDGSLVMDDGQNWLLVMKKDGKTYPIYNDYLQLGDIDFVLTPFNGELGVLMIMTAHSDTTIKKVVYDEQEDSYKVETLDL